MLDVTGRVAVVGAGVSGLAAARSLADHGIDVVLFDKGRGPGGRTSVRRRAGFEFDHGAQFFTVRDADFRAQVDVWLDAGVAALWHPRRAVFGNARDRDRPSRADGAGSEWYVGVPGMNACATLLARDLDVRTGVRIEHLRRQSNRWQLLTEDGHAEDADIVLVTTPPKQAIPLISSSPRLAERAARAKISPCWAVMLGFASPIDPGFDAAFINDGALAWVARNSSKPGRDGGDAWVLHASTTWSEAHLEAAGGDACDMLTRAFVEECALGSVPEPVHTDAHRWRYALPQPEPADAHEFDSEHALGVAGDWCLAARVEGAFLSGRALARCVIDAVG